MLDHICMANMASPIRRGTTSGSAMTSRDIDILKEKIFIQIDKQNHTALYKIDYNIKCDSSGLQVPLLFYALDYKDDFKIWIDNKEVLVEEIPEDLTDINDAPLQNFHESLFSSDWDKNLEWKMDINDLKYFEIDLEKGIHQIHIEYRSNAWVDLWDWVKKYSFKYSLFPAKSWRSFKSIEIALKASGNNYEINTNLGNPTEGNLDSIAIWKFDKLPADEIEFSYKPQVSLLARILLVVKPLKMMVLFAIIVTIVHLIFIKRYRIRNPEKKYSWIVIVGSILIPFITLIWYMYSYEIIDSLIGPEASRYHGYTFLVIVFYPVILPIYWLIMWQFDRKIKRKYFFKTNQEVLN